MDRSPTRDLIVGIFVLAGLSAIAWLSISIGGLSWHGRTGMKLFAAFNETGSLTTGAPVVIAGVRVGKISGISLQKDFRARVEMDLDPDLKLPSDTFASIVTAGVLGDRYIELGPGGDEKFLKSGDSITLTEPGFVLEDLIRQLVYGTTKESKPAPPDSAKATQPGK